MPSFLMGAKILWLASLSAGSRTAVVADRAAVTLSASSEVSLTLRGRQQRRTWEEELDRPLSDEHAPFLWESFGSSLLETDEEDERGDRVAAPASEGTGASRRAKVYYVVYSDSAFYNTRLKWVTDIWAKSVNSSLLAVIGDEPLQRPGVNVVATTCPKHSHEEGACCKYAQAVIHAKEALQKDPSVEWVYFTDDDAYIRTDALERALAQQPNASTRNLVLSQLGCGTKLCPVSICAGAGYAATRKAVEAAVGNDPAAFLQLEMQNCGKCDLWADAAMTQIFLQRSFEVKALPGVHAWQLTKKQLDYSLRPQVEPLMYHYVHTEQQMNMFHRLFSTDGAAANQTANQPGELCLTYRSSRQCSASAAPADRPWVDESRRMVPGDFEPWDRA